MITYESLVYTRLIPGEDIKVKKEGPLNRYCTISYLSFPGVLLFLGGLSGFVAGAGLLLLLSFVGFFVGLTGCVGVG